VCLRLRLRLSVCACACIRENVREWERVCPDVCARIGSRIVCVRECVYARMCVHWRVETYSSSQSMFCFFFSGFSLCTPPL